MVVLVCPGVGRRKIYGQRKRGINYTVKNPADFFDFPLPWEKKQEPTLWGGTSVVDGGKFANLAVYCWVQGRGIGKRGEKSVRIQLHCEKWQIRARNKYSP